MKFGFLASHGGSNMQAILDACVKGRLDAQPVLLICNNRNAGAIERAENAKMPVAVLNGKTHPNEEELDQAMLNALQKADVQLIVLAGYMKKIGPKVLQTYNNRILNIHPSLLPKFGGQGMYGMNVHKAVIASGETKSGATVHLISAIYDEGPILQQIEVPVLPDDTPESLQLRVLEKEHFIYPDTLAKVVSGEIQLPTQ